MDVRTLTEIIQKNKIAIYGTGYVAKAFYNCLVKKKMTNNLACFITSDGGGDFNGYDVLSITDIRIQKMLILIAVHESIKDEIIENIESRGLHNYVWICPELLYTMMLGDPIQKNVCVPLKQIWIDNRNNYGLAVRYLAIENYFARNEYGFEIYKLAMSLFSNPQTAERRLFQFIELIRNWSKNGYDKSKVSMILDNGSYIDGVHRIALASYFNQEYVICDIYSSDNNLKEIHDKKARLDKSFVQKWNIEEGIIRILEETNRRIDEQYGLN